MKSLKEIVNDLRDMSSMLQDLSGDLGDLANFFGGTVAPPPKPVQHVSKQAPPKPFVGEVDTQPKKRKYTPDPTIRPLLPEEKQLIRKDWDSLPPHQRTKEMRTALARKYQCSGSQIFGLTREPGVLESAVAASKKARAERMLTQTSS